MTGCSAAGCTNRHEKGFKLHAFPRDPHRRAVWASKVNRLNWQPSERSRLCEAHFDSDQWEKVREDGSKKLKCVAVPTLFNDITPRPKRKLARTKLGPVLPKLRKISTTRSRGIPCIEDPITICQVQLTESEESTEQLNKLVKQKEERIDELTTLLKQKDELNEQLSKRLDECKKIGQELTAQLSTLMRVIDQFQLKLLKVSH